MSSKVSACALLIASVTMAATAFAADGTTPAPVTPAADAAKSATPLPGHSQHGEAFNEGPRQKPYLMGGTGDVHLPITTRVPLAQQFFDQGVGQLHGFWYFEAERSFRQVAALDADCGMAYWGMAMANINNERRAKGFVKVAVQKKPSVSPREAAWIDALAASYGEGDATARKRQYVRDLESLVQDDPNDVEAKAFLALAIWQNSGGTSETKTALPITSHQAVDALLDQILAAQPMHPAHHYRIHLWDNEKPARALVSASLCGQSAPAIAHMWHMPGHTYSKLHRYADAAWQQEASARVDHARMMRDMILPDQIHNYAHNNEWLIRDLALVGRVHDALTLALNMVDLPRHPKYNTPEKPATSARFGRIRLAEVLVQYELWKELISPSILQDLRPDKPDSDEQIEHLRRLGLAHFGLGNAEEGRRQITALEALLAERRAARYKAADEAEATARKNKKSDADVAKAMADALSSRTAGLTTIENALAELRGHAALAAGDQALARSEFEKAKANDKLRKDQLARAFLLAGDAAGAESLARAAVEKGPGEVYPLAVLAEVLWRAGKRPEALAEFGKLRTLAAQADLDVPVFERLRPLAEHLGLPSDWRIARGEPADVGQRPELATLGPFCWQPSPAPSWSLPGAQREIVSLEQYRGKPVVVIFYLGSGCLHCVEQLHKFAPLNADFAGAGISIVAISSEPLDSLKASLAKLSPNEPIPFPLAADPQYAVFKQYRAYDDFESMPLHGTFLIDGDGMVRWQDISYEPFSDAKFLLAESKRLLALPHRADPASAR